MNANIEPDSRKQVVDLLGDKYGFDKEEAFAYIVSAMPLRKKVVKKVPVDHLLEIREGDSDELKEKKKIMREKIAHAPEKEVKVVKSDADKEAAKALKEAERAQKKEAERAQKKEATKALKEEERAQKKEADKALKEEERAQKKEADKALKEAERAQKKEAGKALKDVERAQKKEAYKELKETLKDALKGTLKGAMKEAGKAKKETENAKEVEKKVKKDKVAKKTPEPVKVGEPEKTPEPVEICESTELENDDDIFSDKIDGRNVCVNEVTGTIYDVGFDGEKGKKIGKLVDGFAIYF